MRRFRRAASMSTMGFMIHLGLRWSRRNVLLWKCIGSVKTWLGNYFYFSKATACIRGLVLGHSFVNSAIVSVLITYLEGSWSRTHFEMAALVTNVQEGVTEIMVIVLAHISETHITRFKMIVCTNAAYLLGLVLLWICSMFMRAHTAARVYYGAAVLIVFGEAGRKATLKEFLEDQYFSEQREIPSTNDQSYLKRLETRKKAVWDHPWFLGAFAALFLSTVSWTLTFMVSTILVGVFYALFLLGKSCYFTSSRIDESTWESRLEYVQKLAVDYPVEQELRGGEICVVTRVTSSSSPAEAAQRIKFWPLIQLKGENRFFIEVIAMWSTFFVYSLVDATGSTFFFGQMNNLDNQVGSLKVSPLYFTVMSKFSSFLVSFLYELLPRQWRKATLVKIGFGLACSALCCFAAWQVERNRLKSIRDQGLQQDTETTISMSILWLVPQFFLLGLMEGLALDGLTDFLTDRIANSDRPRARFYASHISDFILGCGKLVTALSILLFKRSIFDKNMNTSRLDSCFKVLTYASLGNLIYYMCISLYIYHNEKSRKPANEEDQKISPLMEQVVQGIVADENGNVEVPDPVGCADVESRQSTVEEVLESDDEAPLHGGVEFRNQQSDGEVELQNW